MVLCRCEKEIALAFTAVTGTMMVPRVELSPVSPGAPPHATDAVGSGASQLWLLNVNSIAEASQKDRHDGLRRMACTDSELWPTRTSTSISRSKRVRSFPISAAISSRLERGDAGAEPVARLLRQAHTLKGAARVVRLPRIAEIAHAMEDALAPHRGSPGAVSKEEIGRLLSRSIKFRRR